jgi:hypothetical protein
MPAKRNCRRACHRDAGQKGFHMHQISSRPLRRNRSHFRHASRRDAPVVCATCGRQVERRARQQLYCSARCQERARYRFRGRGSGAAKINAVAASVPGKPLKKAFHFNGAKISGLRPVLQVELFDRTWQQAVSSGGVTIEVGRLRPRTLVNNDGWCDWPATTDGSAA